MKLFGNEPLGQKLEHRHGLALVGQAEGAGQGRHDIWRERNVRRVCGLSPIYHTLLCARPQPGKLLAYAQCPADENGGSDGRLGDGSIVSIASLCF